MVGIQIPSYSVVFIVNCRGRNGSCAGSGMVCNHSSGEWNASSRFCFFMFLGRHRLVGKEVSIQEIEVCLFLHKNKQ
jgi:hypothetical protein